MFAIVEQPCPDIEEVFVWRFPCRHRPREHVQTGNWDNEHTWKLAFKTPRFHKCLNRIFSFKALRDSKEMDAHSS